MEKKTFKVLANSPGLEASQPAPLELANQRAILHEHLADSTPPAEDAGEAADRYGNGVLDRKAQVLMRSEEKKPKIKVRLTSKALDFTLEFPAYEVNVQDRCINVQVMPEFALNSSRMDFTLETEGQTYEVAFLGLTVSFKDFQALTFVRKETS